MGKAILAHVLSHLDEYEADDIIYVPQNTDVDLDTVVHVIPYEKMKVGAPEGAEYFLEVGVVREVLCGINDQLNGEPSELQKIRALKYYVQHDDYIGIEDLTKD